MTTISCSKPIRFGGLLVGALVLISMLPAMAQHGKGLADAGPVRIAQADRRFAFDIPSQALARSLSAFSAATGLQVLYTETAAFDHTAPSLRGRFAAELALDRLVDGSGLGYRFVDERTVTLIRAASINGPIKLAPITVEAEAASFTPSTGTIGTLPPTFAGDQVATGQRLGLLGNRDRMETPLSAQSYTAELIKNQQARDVVDVLQNDPSVGQNYTRYQGVSFSSSRGINIPVDTFAFDGMNNLLPTLTPSLIGIERVEVIRGPVSLFTGVTNTFGSVAGGVINLVPKRAGAEPTTQLLAGYQSDSTFYGQFDLGRRFGENQQFGLRLGGLLQDGDSPVDFNKRYEGAVALGLDYAGDRFRATFDLRYQDSEVDGQSREISTFVGDRLPSPPDTSSNFNQPWASLDQTSTLALGRVEYDVLQKTTLFAAVGIAEDKNIGLTAFPSSLQNNGNFDVSTGNYIERYKRRNAEAGVRSEFATGPVDHELVLSASYAEHDDFFGFNGFTTPPTVSNLYDLVTLPRPEVADLPDADNPNLEARFAGLTIVDTLSVLDGQVQLTLGLRNQRFRLEQFDGATGEPSGDAYDEQTWSPGLALLVRPSETLSLYGNYLESLAQGGVAPLTAANAGTALKPIVSTQYEIGAKLEYPGLGANLALFQIEEMSSGVDPDTNLFGEVGELRIRGIELSIFGEPVEGFRLLGGVTFLDTEFIESATPSIIGNEQPGTPDFSLVANAEYDMPFFAGLTLTGRIVHKGDAFVNQNNGAVFPSWTRLDLGARYQFENKTLRLSVENVTDKGYFIGSQFGEVSLGAPRTFLLSVSYDL